MLPFEPCMLKIENDADRQSSDAEIVEHLPTLKVRNPVDCLGVNDQLLLDDEIGNILSNQLALIQHPMPLLLRVRNTAASETPRRDNFHKSSRAAHVRAH